ncbi:MAG: FG-GAP repeat protein [Alphaproteobacteria bacterium]|nr:FG-GAP repeat protein [Alphaproteobacteria bacterium]
MRTASLLLLVGCPFPDFPAATGTDGPTPVPTDTGPTDTGPTDTAPPTPPPPLPRLLVQSTSWVAGGPYAARTDTGFLVSGYDRQVLLYDAQRNAAGTWTLPTDPPGGSIQDMLPVGRITTDVPRQAFSAHAAEAGDGRVHLVDAAGAAVLVSPPAGEGRFFARTAAVVEGRLLVAAGGESSALYRYDDPTGNPTGTLSFPDIGSGDGGRFLGSAQLDADPELEVLFGTGGDAFDPSAVFGVEVPEGVQEAVPVEVPNVRFRYSAVGANQNFYPPVGATAVVLDLDGDGCDDLLVGAPYDSGERGELQVVDCLSQAVATQKDLTSAGRTAAIGPVAGYLGASLVVLDGFLEPGQPAIAVSARGVPSNDGHVYVFRPVDLVPGRALDLTVHTGVWMEIHDAQDAGPADLGDETGIGLANLGDLDGDGRDDLAISGRYEGMSRVYVWPGGHLLP